MMKADVLKSVKRQFEYYRSLGEKAMEQVSDEQLFIQVNEESNSMAMVVQHLWGNMMSRWTDFLNSDGEKEWRKRDQEFEVVLNSRAEVMEKWNEGWTCLFNALNSLSNEDLDRIVYIRNEGHFVLEAINRQLAHYPYHIGQIVFIAKMLKNDRWRSLSIPRNHSKDYNARKFSEEKGVRHFTDEFLKKKDEKK